MLLGIHHTTFLSSDLPLSRHFYEHVLGLQLDINRPQMSFEGVWYRVTANQQIHLMRLPNPEANLLRPAHGGRDRHVAFSITDIAELIRRLEEAGINYSLSQSGRRALFCRDPDHNALEFIEIGM